MNLIIKKTLAAVFLLILIIPVSAQEGIYGSAGLKFINSEDSDTSRKYYKPFALVGWSGDLIDISVSYYRWISYSITDAQYKSKEIDFNQPETDITIYLSDLFSISAGYSYMNGESSYTAYRITGEIVFDFENFDVSADSSLKNTEYDFNGTIKNSAISAGGEMSFDFADNFSSDIGYQYSYTDYDTYGYKYSKNIGRLGIVVAPASNLFFLAGVSGGVDSDDILIAAFDAGITMKIYQHLKISVSYMLTADFISSDSSSATRGRWGSPDASTSSSTDTLISHTGSIGISLYF